MTCARREAEAHRPVASTPSRSPSSRPAAPRDRARPDPRGGRARLSLLVPVLALLLGALGLLAAAPAQAQTTVWSATLTVVDVSDANGCNNSYGVGSRCADSSVLDDDDFNHDVSGTSTNFEFYRIWSSTNRLLLEFRGTSATNIKTKLAGLTFTVGTGMSAKNFAIADATQNTSETRQLQWSGTTANLGWSEDDTVALKLTKPASTDNTAPTVVSASTGYYTAAAATTVLTGPLKSGVDIYTKVTFSEDMKHTKGDGNAARPALSYRIGTTDMRYDILNNADTLASGDCKPNHATNTNVYICLYTVGSSDNGAFAVKAGTASVDKANNALAAVYTHSATLALDTTAPAAPVSLNAAAGNAKVTLTWSDPSPADATISKWQYRQKTTGTYGNWQNISGGASARRAEVGSLSNGTAYTFQVRAVDTAANDGAAGTAGPVTPTLPAISGLSATPARTSVTLNWTNPSTCSAIAGCSYRVRHRTTGGTWGSWTTTGVTFSSATVSSLTASTSYEFMLERRVGGNAVARSTISATTLSALPAKPANFRATAGNTQVTLAWDNPSDSTITKYQLARKKKSATGTASFADIAGSGATTTSHTVTGLDNGDAYQFWLRAVNAAGNGIHAGPAEATPAASDSTAPTVLSASTGYYTTAAAATALTGPLKSGVDIYTKVTFSEDMKHTKSDGNAARPALSYRIGTTDRRYDILNNADTLASGDCKPNHATSTNVYICRYTVGSSDNGAFAVKAGTASVDKADNALAATYTHTTTLALDTTAPAAPVSLAAVPGDAKVTLTWSDPSPTDATISKWQVRQKTTGTYGSWTDVSGGASARRVEVGSLSNGTAYTFQVRAVDTAANDGAAGTAGPVTPSATSTSTVPTAQTVQSDWSLKPSGITAGQSFRLLFVTSTQTAATATGISTYNSFVQNAANNNTVLRPFKGEFRALVSTQTVDARGNTATTGAGVPIYWVGGAKVADDYADFYDGSWDSRVPTNELGQGRTFGTWTGSKADGTKDATRYAGASRVRTAAPHLGTTNPVSLGSQGNTDELALYALSPVITVRGSTIVPPPPPSSPNKLVGNVAQRASAHPVTFKFDAAQWFRTGRHPGGYRLTHVDIGIKDGSSTTPSYMVKIHAPQSTVPYSTGSGLPGEALGTLTNPGSLPTGGGFARFTASGSGIDLAPRSNYFVVIDVGGSGDRNVVISTAASSALDRDSVAEWGFHDVSWKRSADSTGGWTKSPPSPRLQMAVYGTAKAAPAPATEMVPAGAIWSASLTVDDLGGGWPYYGCGHWNAGFVKCAVMLSDDDFVHGGVTYRIHALEWNAREERLGLDLGPDHDASVLTALGSLTLHVDGRTFAFGDARFNGADGIHWPWDGPWREGQRVSLALTDGGTPSSEPEATAPALEWARVNGAELALRFDQGLDETSLPAAAAFSVSVAGAPRAVSSVSVSQDLVTLTLGSAVSAGEAVTVGYTPPSSGKLRLSGGGAAVAAFSGLAVTNDTPSGQPQQESPPGAVDPLTASVSQAPSEHPGKGRFAVQIGFSEAVTARAKDAAATIAVTGGTLVRAVRVDKRKDLWALTLAPSGSGAVTVTLPATSDCSAAGAICTADGRRLETALTHTVQGAVTLSVADASAQEAAGATMDFAVTLSRAASGKVTVSVGLVIDGGVFGLFDGRDASLV